MIVTRPGDCSSRRCDIAIKVFQYLLARGNRSTAQGLSFGSDVELVEFNAVVSPCRDIRKMSCEPSHRARLGMRTPFPFLVGYTLQRAACGRHLLIKFGK